jgi:ribulose-bisphosphate carboxylase large chain
MVPAMSNQRFLVTYHVTPTDSRPIEDHAMDICIEQTVEIPKAAIPKGHWEQGIVGKTESIRQLPGSPPFYEVVISYRVDITGNAIPNLMNVLFGNISILRGIRLMDAEFEPGQFEAFGGPRFGIHGIRNLLGVAERPLTMTALKPLGLSPQELAKLAHGFALGGLDLIKDDHGLINQHFHPFKDRVARIMDALREAEAKTGRRCLYYPMLAGRFDEVEEHAAFAKEQGCHGLLVPPMLIGPDTGFHLARKYDLAVVAHPTMTGSNFSDPRHGISIPMMLGKLPRLFGTDISVFPNAGGRFGFTAQDCQQLCGALRNPFGGLKPAFPAPAGGMTIERVGEMIETFGNDTVLLIGGALLLHSPSPEQSARAFTTSLERAFAARTKS